MGNNQNNNPQQNNRNNPPTKKRNKRNRVVQRPKRKNHNRGKKMKENEIISTDLSLINELRKNYISKKNHYRKAGEDQYKQRYKQFQHAVISYYEVLRPHLATNQDKQLINKYFNTTLLYKAEKTKIKGLKYLDNFLDNSLEPTQEQTTNFYGEAKTKTNFKENIIPEEMAVRAGTLLEELYNQLGFAEEIQTRQQEHFPRPLHRNNAHRHGPRQRPDERLSTACKGWRR